MAGTFGQYQSDVASVALIEEQIVCGLSLTASTIAHMDCFDAEERSEIYTILQALREDTVAHQTMLGQWVSDRKGN